MLCFPPSPEVVKLKWAVKGCGTQFGIVAGEHLESRLMAPTVLVLQTFTSLLFVMKRLYCQMMLMSLVCPCQL